MFYLRLQLVVSLTWRRPVEGKGPGAGHGGLHSCARRTRGHELGHRRHALATHLAKHGLTLVLTTRDSEPREAAAVTLHACRLTVIFCRLNIVAEPSNLMPPRSTCLPLDIKYPKEDTKLRRIKLTTFLSHFLQYQNITSINYNSGIEQCYQSYRGSRINLTTR